MYRARGTKLDIKYAVAKCHKKANPDNVSVLPVKRKPSPADIQAAKQVLDKIMNTIAAEPEISSIRTVINKVDI